jgi:hypothetical protein
MEKAEYNLTKKQIEALKSYKGCFFDWNILKL